MKFLSFGTSRPALNQMSDVTEGEKEASKARQQVSPIGSKKKNGL